MDDEKRQKVEKHSDPLVKNEVNSNTKREVIKLKSLVKKTTFENCTISPINTAYGESFVLFIGDDKILFVNENSIAFTTLENNYDLLEDTVFSIDFTPVESANNRTYVRITRIKKERNLSEQEKIEIKEKRERSLLENF